MADPIYSLRGKAAEMRAQLDALGPTAQIPRPENAEAAKNIAAGFLRARHLSGVIINRIFDLTRASGIKNAEDATVHFCAAHLADMIQHATEEDLIELLAYGSIGFPNFNSCPEYIEKLVIIGTYIKFTDDGCKEEEEMFKMLINDVVPRTLEKFIS